MDDYISREKLRDSVQRNLDMQDLYLPVEFLELIDDAPTADVKPVVRGEWDKDSDVAFSGSVASAVAMSFGEKRSF